MQLKSQLRIKGTDIDNQETKCRDWKNFNLKNYVDGAAAINWTEFYKIENLDVAQYWMERKLTELLDKEAKWKTIQPHRNFRNWISEETKKQMKNRDAIREAASDSKSAEQWKLYRELRNDCSQRIKDDRREHFKARHEKLEKDNNSRGTYSLLKSQAGWKTGHTKMLQSGWKNNLCSQGNGKLTNGSLYQES